MLLASAYAGVGFGHAGVHLPHAMSYPVAGMVRGFRPEGYNVDHPLVPHGISVILNAPAVFRFTASASPERHLRVAQLLGKNITGVRPEDAGSVLSDCLIETMQRLGMPNGLRAVGYSPADIPSLVEGTVAQQRLTKLAPRQAGRAELTSLFEDSMTAW
jgi:hydroxyacid-oxoacid transhydrogenase